ncbi:MAG TPA: hypothetical protein VIV58_22585 [Kofleriaceae bacterium]
MSAERILKSSALKAARAKLPILGDKALQEELDFAIGDCSRCSDSRAYAEAYRLGAEAAQRVIAGKISALGNKPRAASPAKPPEVAP